MKIYLPLFPELNEKVKSKAQFRLVQALRHKKGKKKKSDKWAQAPEWTKGVEYKDLPEKK